MTLPTTIRKRMAWRTIPFNLKRFCVIGVVGLGLCCLSTPRAHVGALNLSDPDFISKSSASQDLVSTLGVMAFLACLFTELLRISLAGAAHPFSAMQPPKFWIPRPLENNAVAWLAEAHKAGEGTPVSIVIGGRKPRLADRTLPERRSILYNTWPNWHTYILAQKHSISYSKTLGVRL